MEHVAGGLTPMAYVPKCTKCGKLDSRQSFSSPDEAAKRGAFERWTCPTCAWSEFELVDEPERAETTPRS
jgi:hypothetical protein